MDTNKLNQDFVDDINHQVDFHFRKAMKEKLAEMPNTIAEVIGAGLEEVQRLVVCWAETACLFSRNESYYRGLLDQIGENIGDDAYTCDDGSKSTSVLRANLPQLVADLKLQRDSWYNCAMHPAPYL